MRKLGQKLGVEAMSLYNHVRNKVDMLDGMVDVVFSEIELPANGADWRTAMRKRAMATRQVLLRHPWAIGLMECGPRPVGRPYDITTRCLEAYGRQASRSIWPPMRTRSW